jgi:hypothetical protein
MPSCEPLAAGFAGVEAGALAGAATVFAAGVADDVALDWAQLMLAVVSTKARRAVSTKLCPAIRAITSCLPFVFMILCLLMRCLLNAVSSV